MQQEHSMRRMIVTWRRLSWVYMFTLHERSSLDSYTYDSMYSWEDLLLSLVHTYTWKFIFKMIWIWWDCIIKKKYQQIMLTWKFNLNIFYSMGVTSYSSMKSNYRTFCYPQKAVITLLGTHLIKNKSIFWSSHNNIISI